MRSAAWLAGVVCGILVCAAWIVTGRVGGGPMGAFLSSVLLFFVPLLTPLFQGRPVLNGFALGTGAAAGALGFMIVLEPWSLAKAWQMNADLAFVVWWFFLAGFCVLVGLYGALVGWTTTWLLRGRGSPPIPGTRQ